MINIDLPKPENVTLKYLEFIDRYLSELIREASNERATSEEPLSTYMEGVAFGYRNALQLVQTYEYLIRNGEEIEDE